MQQQPPLLSSEDSTSTPWSSLLLLAAVFVLFDSPAAALFPLPSPSVSTLFSTEKLCFLALFDEDDDIDDDEDDDKDFFLSEIETFGVTFVIVCPSFPSLS